MKQLVNTFGCSGNQWFIKDRIPTVRPTQLPKRVDVFY